MLMYFFIIIYEIYIATFFFFVITPTSNALRQKIEPLFYGLKHTVTEKWLTKSSYREIVRQFLEIHNRKVSKIRDIFFMISNKCLNKLSYV